MSGRENRPQIVGPEHPQDPYPIPLESVVIGGYGRGSAELGIPTANIPQDDFDTVVSKLKEGTGIYYGYAKVEANCSPDSVKKPELTRDVNYTYGGDLISADRSVWPMVMSIGWNPFYGNEKKSAEIHVIHKYTTPFYGAKIKLILLGYIRPELNYVSKEALIHDIETDIEVALKSLDRPAYKAFEQDEFLS